MAAVGAQLLGQLPAGQRQVGGRTGAHLLAQPPAQTGDEFVEAGIAHPQPGAPATQAVLPVLGDQAFTRDVTAFGHGDAVPDGEFAQPGHLQQWRQIVDEVGALQPVMQGEERIQFLIVERLDREGLRRRDYAAQAP